MEIELLKTVGQIAGIGGLSIGLVFLLFREVIRKNIFPNLTKAQSFKVITIVVICTWSIALAGIAAWVYTETHNPKKVESVELSGIETYLKPYGFSTVSVVDLNLKNRGSLPGNISKLKIDVLEVFEYSYDPCGRCYRFFANGIYNINLKQVVDGNNEFIVSHIIPPEDIEKLKIVLGGDYSDRSYLARVVFTIYTGKGSEIKTKPLDVLVQNFDDGKTVPIDQIGNERLKGFIDSGSRPPLALTPDVIKSFFRGGSNSPGFGARVPSLPDWFDS